MVGRKEDYRRTTSAGRWAGRIADWWLALTPTAWWHRHAALLAALGSIAAVVSVVVAIAAWQMPVTPPSNPAPTAQPFTRATTTATTEATTTAPTATETTLSLESTPDEPVTEAPPPTATAAAIRSARTKLYVTVDDSVAQYRIRGQAHTYTADRDIVFVLHVSDDFGPINDRCGTSVRARPAGGGDPIKTDHWNGCDGVRGWMSLPAGSYRIEFDVSTEWGAGKKATIPAEMIDV